MMETPEKSARQKRTGRAAFTAVRDAVRVELEQGWTMTATYEKRAEQLGISYSQFTRYVGVHIRGRSAKPRQFVRDPVAIHAKTLF